MPPLNTLDSLYPHTLWGQDAKGRSRRPQGGASHSLSTCRALSRWSSCPQPSPLPTKGGGLCSWQAEVLCWGRGRPGPGRILPQAPGGRMAVAQTDALRGKGGRRGAEANPGRFFRLRPGRRGGGAKRPAGPLLSPWSWLKPAKRSPFPCGLAGSRFMAPECGAGRGRGRGAPSHHWGGSAACGGGSATIPSGIDRQHAEPGADRAAFSGRPKIAELSIDTRLLPPSLLLRRVPSASAQRTHCTEHRANE